MLRTHTCGELRKEHVDKEVTLCGWVHKIRTHGNLTFLDVRDRYGITQVTATDNLSETIKDLRRESVVKIKGMVVLKPQTNKALETGDIEIASSEIEVLNESEILPLSLDDDANTTDEIRLKYRYLDLRKKDMTDNIVFRHRVGVACREFLNKEKFLEIETPLLIRSTPEGARDFLVPSRVNKSCFYSLPQSPQLYKQLLMVSGFDKYYQLAKCLRDEDLRSDRQPEFTQLDLEMSFVEENDVLTLLEKLVQYVVKETKGIDIKIPFRRLSYNEAMQKYGCDKPDLRFGLELFDATDILKKSELNIFQEAELIKGIVIPKTFSRKETDKLTEFVKIHKAKGLAFTKIENNNFETGISKFLTEDNKKELLKLTKVKEGETIFFVADKQSVTNESMAKLRNLFGKELNLIDSKELNFSWVHDFPLFEWDDDENRWSPMHHIFSMPKKELMNKLETNPGEVLGYLYDMVLNGTEVGGGSIRIHKEEIQSRVLKVIGMSIEEANNKFGFLMNAFKYGAPPHGGFAFGFDRLVTLLNDEEDIREFIAFPKNKNMQSPLDECPSKVDKEQLDELNIQVKE